jgi:MFS transporter, DHA1 family, inner membrane transport protein
MIRTVRPGASPWATIALVAGGGVISAWQVGKVPVALDMIRTDLALDLAAASWLLSAFAFIGAVAGAPIGLVIDRVGAKRMMIAGLLLQGLASEAGSVATNEFVLGATRVMEGLGFLGVVVAAPALIVTLASPGDRERAMALWATFMPAGMGSIMLAAPLLDALTWRGFWMLIGLAHIAYVAAIVARVHADEATHSVKRDIRNDIERAIASPGPWLLGGLFAAQAASFFAVFGFLPSILSERLAVNGSAAGVLSAIAVASSALGNIVCGQLLARGLASLQLLWMSFAALALCSFGIFNDHVPGAIAYVLCLVFSIAGGLIPVVVLDAAPRYAPEPGLIGLTLGFAMQGNNIGLALGPAAVGSMVSAAGWWTIPYLITATAAAAGVMILALAHVRTTLRHR